LFKFNLPVSAFVALSKAIFNYIALCLACSNCGVKPKLFLLNELEIAEFKVDYKDLICDLAFDVSAAKSKVTYILLFVAIFFSFHSFYNKIIPV